MMNYEQAISYIHGIYKRGKKDGLKRIAELCSLCGNPQKKLRFIHVAGTNGKGSTCVMLSEILSEAGYKTGLYTSPFITRFNERMQINNAPIENDELANITQYISEKAETMDILPSEFELVTVIAFEYFLRNGCDVVVLETGLGGMFDATNIIDTTVMEIITPIDLDHMRELGDTIAKIAEHKAGIIKNASMCVSSEQVPEAEKVIRAACEQKKVPLSVADPDDVTLLDCDLHGQKFLYENTQYTLSLLGDYQLSNASTVLKAVNVLRSAGFKIKNEDIATALATVCWQGRFELLRENPVVIVDGGHNPQGVKAAVESAKKYLNGKTLTVVLGVMADKDFCEMFHLIDSIADRYIATAPNYPRAMESEHLAELLNQFGKPVVEKKTVKEAVEAAIDFAKADHNGAVLCIGTLYMIGDVRKAAKEIPDEL